MTPFFRLPAPFRPAARAAAAQRRYGGPPESCSRSHQCGRALRACLLVYCAVGCASRTAPESARPLHAGPVGATGASSAGHPLPAAFPRTLTDAAGDTLRLLHAPTHIVSLAPSATEILFSIGAGPRVVLDTTSCDYPPAAREVPHVDALAASPEGVLARSPDLVVALMPLDGRMVAALKRYGVPLLQLRADTLAQVYQAIQVAGAATGEDARAAALVDQMRRRIAAASKAAAAGGSRPTVLFMWGVNPIYTTGPGSFMDDILQVAGGRNVIRSAPPGGVVSPERALQLQPQVIVCSRPLVAQVERIPGWATGVPAVREHRFYTDEDTLVRPGPRLADAAEQLARFLHPKVAIKSP